MKIADIDPNLKVPETLELDGLNWMSAGSPEFVLYGTPEDCKNGPYRRIPKDVAESTSPGVAILATNTAGLRLRFRTDSPYVAVHAEWNEQVCFPHMAVTGVSGFDLYRMADGGQEFVGAFQPQFSSPNGYESGLGTPGGMQDFVLNFPLYNDVNKLYIGVRSGSRFEKPGRYVNDRPVIFYGSSITQGGCASRPGNAYQNMLSRTLNMDYYNLGFSGNGCAEDTIVRYMASLPMSVFVSDYDHNAPSAEHLRATHFKMYEKVRAANPDVPYVILSKPDGRSVYPEGLAANKERRDIIRATYEKAKASGDGNVYFIDGFDIFGDGLSDTATVDTCHPNDLGFRRYHDVLLPVFRKIGF